MVCFECGRCNETIKKPKLAKHLLYFCRQASVTCIDCNTVFAWDAWEEHTKCISEAQKYQGNLFQAKESQNKNQKKQEGWIERVEEIIEDPSSGIAPETRNLLKKLLGFSNIPRKQKPFCNFAKNSLNMWDDRKIDLMWQVIVVATKKPEASPPAAAPPAPAAAEKIAPPVQPEAASKPEKPSKPASKPAEAEAEPEADQPEKRKWVGWKEAVDEELAAAEDRTLPWKKLRKRIVARYREESEEANGESKEELGNLAMAEIPESYLLEDDFIRLPKKKKQR